MRTMRNLFLIFLLVVSVTPPAWSQKEELDRLNSRVIELYRQGKYSEAIPVAQKDLEVAEKTLGLSHPRVATSLNNLAELYRAQGYYADAEPLYKRALQIYEKALGTDHPSVASSLNNLAELYREQGNYVGAEPLYKRALQIYEKALGADHPSVATSLNNLALLYHAQGRYADAEPLYKKALQIYGKSPGADQQEVATSLSNLAGLYHDQGNYAEAEALHKRALALREEVLGEDHPDVATSLNNLAALYDYLGNYARAEALYKRALQIYERALGEDHPNVATALNNLALLYTNQGRPADAELFYKRALAVRENALGADHPDVATSLNNLALLYHDQGRYAEAEPLCKRALQIYGRALGANHPNVAASLTTLAFLYSAQGRYADAEPLHKRALALSEKVLGADHPDIATSLNDLAALYAVQGRHADAEPLYKRALQILEKAFGPAHPKIATCLSNLALQYAASHREDAALPLLKRSLAIDNKVIANVFSFASEREKLAFLTTVQYRYEAFLSLVLQKFPQNQEALLAGITAVLQRKGMVLDALSREKEALLRSEKSEVRKAYRSFQEISSRLALLTLAGPGDKEPQLYLQTMAALEIEKERLEKELSSLSESYRTERETRSADPQGVGEALPQGTLLVEYVSCPMLNLSAKGEKKQWGASRYLAFILPSLQGSGKGDRPPPPSSLARPLLIDLGEAIPINKAVQEFREEIARAESELRSGLFKEETAERRLGEKGRDLYNLIVAPLKSVMGVPKAIYIAPDADLNLLPFGALQDETGKYLLETTSLQYLSSGRDLIRLKEGASSSRESLIVADPDFDAGAADRDLSARRLLAGTPPVPMQRGERSSSLARADWARLEGTREESALIGRILSGEPLKLYLGQDALEEVVKHAISPRCLHIATHGFFLEDQPRQSSKGAGPEPQLLEGGRGTSVALTIENPLLRSGLVLAGASRIGREELPESEDDGILTALEVSGMQLTGTDLVVLSACETGLGVAVGGEGVFGLRRAFQLAGARTVVMSLWSVPDQQTQELMGAFYQRMQSGERKGNALREAQVAMINERRAKYGAAHPFFWGAFISVGEP